MSAAAIPPEFAVQDLVSSSYDIYTLLYHLHTKSHHSGVRDFLIHKLFTRSHDEIELILPQLCHCFEVWSPDNSNTLGEYFVYLSTQSIHFAVKIFWTLRAQQAHCHQPVQRDAIDRLLASCEMALVNQSIIGSDGRMRKQEIVGIDAQHHPIDVANGSGLMRMKSEEPTRHSTDIRVSSRDSSPRRRGSDSASSQSHPFPIGGGSRTVHSRSNSGANTPISSTPRASPALASFPPPLLIGSSNVSSIAPLSSNSAAARSSSPTSPVSPSASPPPHFTSSPPLLHSQSLPPHEASLIESTSDTSSSSSTSCCSSHLLPLDDLFNLASSKVRSEYFAGLLKLLTDFSRVSSAVVKLPQAARKKKLRSYIRELDRSVHGLYFPTYSPDPRHYRILRLLPDETFVLNSRDKAPFLFHFEIQYFQERTVYDPDIYLGYKSREQIIQEAIEMNQCSKCVKIGREKRNSMRNSSGSIESETVNEERNSISPILPPHSTSPASSIDDSTLAPSANRSAEPIHVVSTPSSSGRLQHTTSVPQEMDALRHTNGNGTNGHQQASASPRNGSMPAPVPTHHLPKRSPASTSSIPPIHPPPAASSQTPSVAIVASSSSIPVVPVPRPVALQSPFEQLRMQAFGETFSSRKARVQATSRFYATLPNTDVTSLIFKHGDDCRQEVMAMQFIRLFHRVFTDASLPLHLHPYCVLLTSANSGLIETVKDATSIDSLKKNVNSSPHCSSLASFFHYYFRLQGSEAHERALKNFVESLAAYSVTCLREDTLVATFNGPSIPVREVTSATRLLGSRGEEIGVVAVLPPIHSSEMLTIRYQSGSYDVNPDHLVTVRWAHNPFITICAPKTSKQRYRVLLTWLDRKDLTKRQMKTWRYTDFNQPVPADQRTYETKEEAIAAARTFGAHLIDAGTWTTGTVIDTLYRTGPNTQCVHLTMFKPGQTEHCYTFRVTSSPHRSEILSLQVAAHARAFALSWLADAESRNEFAPLRQGDLFEVAAKDLRNLVQKPFFLLGSTIPHYSSGLSSTPSVGSTQPPVSAEESDPDDDTPDTATPTSSVAAAAASPSISVDEVPLATHGFVVKIPDPSPSHNEAESAFLRSIGVGIVSPAPPSAAASAAVVIKLPQKLRAHDVDAVSSDVKASVIEAFDASQGQLTDAALAKKCNISKKIADTAAAAEKVKGDREVLAQFTVKVIAKLSSSSSSSSSSPRTLQLAYEPLKASTEGASEQVDFVYMLNNPLVQQSTKNALGEDAYTFLRLEEAWSTLGIAADQQHIAITELNPLTGLTNKLDSTEAKYDEVCHSSILATIALEPKVVIVFGKFGRRRWLETDLTSMAWIASDEFARSGSVVEVIEKWHEEDINQQSLVVRLDNQHQITVLFSAHPSATYKFDSVLESISKAHGVPLGNRQALYSRLVSVMPSKAGKYVPLQVSSADERFVLGDGAITHNCYLLQIKDRHNGNLMLTQNGAIVHIDFGFILSNSPGGNMNFEGAPFKLTAEYIEVMGGETSEHFDYFKLLVIRGFLAARQASAKCLLLLEILSKNSRMPCWSAGIDATLAALRDRFQLGKTEEECVEFAYAIVEESINDWRTVQYDKYQRITNGIL